MAIPKVIHWSWVGPDTPPPFVKKCVDSWKKYMPEYEIRCWDAKSLEGIDSIFLKEAYKVKAWAFVADYIRIYALLNYGGIYLDSDVEVFKSFTPLLKNSFFSGHDIDRTKKVAGVQGAIMGAEPNHPFLNEFFKYYQDRHFIREDGTNDIVVIPIILGKAIEKYGYEYKDTTQKLPFNSIIYSTAFICDGNSRPYRKPNFAFHINSNSWCYSERGPIARFCWKHRLLPIYRFTENILIKLRKQQDI